METESIQISERLFTWLGNYVRYHKVVQEMHLRMGSLPTLYAALRGAKNKLLRDLHQVFWLTGHPLRHEEEPNMKIAVNLPQARDIIYGIDVHVWIGTSLDLSTTREAAQRLANVAKIDLYINPTEKQRLTLLGLDKIGEWMTLVEREMKRLCGTHVEMARIDVTKVALQRPSDIDCVKLEERILEAEIIEESQMSSLLEEASQFLLLV